MFIRPPAHGIPDSPAGDAPAAEQMLSFVARGATLIADCAYDTNAIRAAVAERGAWANNPPRVIRKDGFAFSAWVCKQRNLVERFFNRIKHFRCVATRHDRSPDNFLAALKLAAIRIWLAAK